MTLARRLLPLPLLLAMTMAVVACDGDGDDALSDEEYFRRMDEIDKDTEERFEQTCEAEEISAKQCAGEFADALSFIETEYEDISPSEDATDEHEELVGSIKELRENVEGAADELSDDEPAAAFFESDASDAGRVNDALCAVQDLADEKGIEADVGCSQDE